MFVRARASAQPNFLGGKEVPNNNDNNGINPAWKPFLDVLPASLHNQVIPVLKDWDAGIQQRFTEIRGEYAELEPFKKFVEANVDPEYIEQSVILADQLQRDPGKIVSQINEAWNLGFVPAEEASKLGQPPVEEDGLDFDADNDIFKDPRVKAMKEALDELQNNFQTDKEREEEEAAVREFEAELDEVEKAYTDPNREGGPLPFNRMFVTALASQGVELEAAVKQYQEVLAQYTTNSSEEPPADSSGDNPPVVMGGEGTAGSGSADGTVDVGSLSRTEVNATVAQLLAKAHEAGN